MAPRKDLRYLADEKNEYWQMIWHSESDWRPQEARTDETKPVEPAVKPP